MFALNLNRSPKLHPNVATLISDAHKEISDVYDKHRAIHKQHRDAVEALVLQGDVDALRQYRQMIRVEATWKVLKARMLQDLEILQAP